jgi:hypothetical protein
MIQRERDPLATRNIERKLTRRKRPGAPWPLPAVTPETCGCHDAESYTELNDNA